MKKEIFIISALFIAGVLSVTVLYFFTEFKHHRDNGFVRLFPPHAVDPVDNIDLTYNSFYFAGISDRSIYLGNLVGPLHLLQCSRDLKDSIHQNLKIKDLDNLKLKTISLLVDSPYFYFLDGVSALIMRGDLIHKETDTIVSKGVFFTEGVPYGNKAFAIRIVNKKKEYVLGKVSSNRFEPKPGILQKQIDGLFCTDGKLIFNSKSNELIYAYHYRNQFIRMDTSLNVISVGKTIDTTTRAQIKIATISSESSVTMAAPPLTVNKTVKSNGTHLFVQSELLASNENRDNFARASVIDVYSLRDNTYRFSFYLYDDGKNKLRDFIIDHDDLYALFGTKMIKYRIVDKLLK